MFYEVELHEMLEGFSELAHRVSLACLSRTGKQQGIVRSLIKLLYILIHLTIEHRNLIYRFIFNGLATSSFSALPLFQSKNNHFCHFFKVNQAIFAAFSKNLPNSFLHQNLVFS
jgi:hypothetical protein